MSVKVRKRNGAWWVFVNYHGRRKAKKVGSRQAAETVKREIEARLGVGDVRILEDQKEPTFAEYAERWLKHHAEIQCKPSTVARYREILRLYLLPAFGPAKLNQVTRTMVKDFISEKVGVGTFSRNSLRLMLSTLRVIFNHAIDNEMPEQKNPAVKLGKLTKGGRPGRKATALSRGEAERFLQATQEYCPQYYPLFLVALRAGLRQGELIALRWGDVQFGESEHDRHRYILVQHNYVRGRFTTPKSGEARRVDLSRQLRQVLLDLRDQRLLEAFTQGKTNISDDLAFPSRVGTILDPANLVHYFFLPCIERAGLRKIRFHELRHTFGSLLMQDGAPITYVKEQMGHRSIKVTVDTYGHLIPGADIGWMDRQDSKTSQQLFATPAQPGHEGEVGESAQVIENYGGPGRTRTYNQRIE